jgi:pilus assembly protein CpaD
MQHSRLSLHALAILLSVGLAGCATAPGSAPLERRLSVEVPHRPQLSQERIVHSVKIAQDGSLSMQEESALAAFIAALRPRYGDRVLIEDSMAQGQEARFTNVARTVSRFGLTLQPPSQRIAQPTLVGEVRVIVLRGAVAMPGCPDWSRSVLAVNATNEVSSNYGCASVGNLANMLADPNDLVQGQELAQGDAASNAKPVAAFNTARPTGVSGDLGPFTSTGPVPKM